MLTLEDLSPWDVTHVFVGMFPHVSKEILCCNLSLIPYTWRWRVLEPWKRKQPISEKRRIPDTWSHRGSAVRTWNVTVLHSQLNPIQFSSTCLSDVTVTIHWHVTNQRHLKIATLSNRKKFHGWLSLFANFLFLLLLCVPPAPKCPYQPSHMIITAKTLWTMARKMVVGANEYRKDSICHPKNWLRSDVQRSVPNAEGDLPLDHHVQTVFVVHSVCCSLLILCVTVKGAWPWPRTSNLRGKERMKPWCPSRTRSSVFATG